MSNELGRCGARAALAGNLKRRGVEDWPVGERGPCVTALRVPTGEPDDRAA